MYRQSVVQVRNMMGGKGAMYMKVNMIIIYIIELVQNLSISSLSQKKWVQTATRPAGVCTG